MRRRKGKGGRGSYSQRSHLDTPRQEKRKLASEKGKEEKGSLKGEDLR